MRWAGHATQMGEKWNAYMVVGRKEASRRMKS
jgi:hypothetical protein